jgi:hypothetical protein
VFTIVTSVKKEVFTMMDAIVAVYLFVVIFSILCWFVTPETVTGKGEEYRQHEMIVDTDNLNQQDTLGEQRRDEVK